MIICSTPKLEKHIVNGKWDGKNYVLAEDWCVDAKAGPYHITIELLRAGFITDGGSIPWWYQWRLNPVGKYLIAYILHDILYATEYLPREVADSILRELIRALGGNRVIRNAVYAAVKVGGGKVWRGHTTESIAHARQLVRGYYSGPGCSFEFGFA